MITINTYQHQASKFISPDITPKEQLTNWALGLAGEAGEVVEPVKKYLFHHRELNVKELSKELGDILWYVAAMCTTLGLSLQDVMTENIDKLTQRYPHRVNREVVNYGQDEAGRRIGYYPDVVSRGFTESGPFPPGTK